MLTEILIAGSQFARLAQRLADHLLGQPADQADLFGDGNEHVGTDHAGQRVDPAREHLEADDLAGREIHLRLEIGNELPVLEAEADALLDLALGNQRALHSGVEPDGPGDAAASRVIHARCRRGAGYPGCGRRPRRRRSDAGEGADLDDPFFEQQRTRDGPQDRLGELVCAATIASARAASATANSSPLRRASDRVRAELVGQRAGNASSAAGRRSHSRAGR